MKSVIAKQNSPKLKPDCKKMKFKPKALAIYSQGVEKSNISHLIQN